MEIALGGDLLSVTAMSVDSYSDVPIHAPQRIATLADQPDKLSGSIQG